MFQNQVTLTVPYLIDGNNLLYAMRKADMASGAAELCRMLGKLAARQDVTVVFDGPPPPRGRLDGQRGLEVLHAAPQSADDVILARIAECTAPRRLTVVSTDRRLRRAASRRRCVVLTSDEFVDVLDRAQQERPKPQEPPEKRKGLSPGESAKWLRLFRLEDDDPEA